MIIGAHPDDADIVCGGTALKLISRGFKVKFVSVTDGRMGHHKLTPDETASVRRRETLEAARRMNLDGYDIYGYPDCGLYPTEEARMLVARKIREYQPDFIITHRTCDYHADHRATGQLVMDATYLLVVPNFCPETPEAKVYPAVFFLRDKFTVPRIMRPDVAVNSAPMLDQWAEAVSSHESQFFEWLPRENPPCLKANPGINAPMEVKREFIKRFWAGRKFVDAKRFNLPFEQAEVFEMSEYGRQLTREELKAIFPEGSFIPEREVVKSKT
jgi:LmbE family N-acetylglucosaminyl deacetylase